VIGDVHPFTAIFPVGLTVALWPKKREQHRLYRHSNRRHHGVLVECSCCAAKQQLSRRMDMHQLRYQELHVQVIVPKLSMRQIAQLGRPCNISMAMEPRGVDRPRRIGGERAVAQLRRDAVDQLRPLERDAVDQPRRLEAATQQCSRDGSVGDRNPVGSTQPRGSSDEGAARDGGAAANSTREHRHGIVLHRVGRPHCRSDDAKFGQPATRCAAGLREYGSCDGADTRSRSSGDARNRYLYAFLARHGTTARILRGPLVCNRREHRILAFQRPGSPYALEFGSRRARAEREE
jgi:hypothetical protein